MIEEDVEIEMKVLIVGNGAVGKSSMIQRYCKGVYTDDYKKTIGVDFLERKISLMDEELRLMIWDTAGQEEFDAMTKTYYRGAAACVVAFSTTDRDSFEAVGKWIEKVENECDRIPMVMVQNKVDLIDRAVMTVTEANDLAEAKRLKLYRTSVQDNKQVDDVFRYLAEEYLKKLKAEDSARAASAQTKKPKVYADAGAPNAASGKPDFRPKESSTGGGVVKVREPTKRGKHKKKGFCG